MQYAGDDDRFELAAREVPRRVMKLRGRSAPTRDLEALCRRIEGMNVGKCSDELLGQVADATPVVEHGAIAAQAEALEARQFVTREIFGRFPAGGNAFGVKGIVACRTIV